MPQAAKKVDAAECLLHPLFDLISARRSPSFSEFKQAVDLVENLGIDLIKKASELLNKGDLPALVWVQLLDQRQLYQIGIQALKAAIDEQLDLPAISRAKLSKEQWLELVELTFQAEQYSMVLQKLCHQVEVKNPDTSV